MTGGGSVVRTSFQGAILSLALVLAACTPSPVGRLAISRPASSVVIEGRVVSPLYRVAAVEADLQDGALVALKDTAGTTCAGGVTGTGGAFRLYRSTDGFTPTEGAYYALEAVKRVGTQGNWVSLKTYVRRENGAWRSITSGELVLSTMTTALSRLVDQDPTLEPADVIGKVAADGTPSALPGFDVDRLQKEAVAVTAQLAVDADPAGDRAFTYSGDLTIDTPEGLALLQELDHVEGNVLVHQLPGVTTISLPLLKSVDGFFAVEENPDLTTLEVPALTSVGDSPYAPLNSGFPVPMSFLLTSNPALTRVQIGPLEEVPGSFGILDNDVLTTIEGADRLKRVGAFFGWSGQPLITNLEAFAALESVQGLAVLRSGVSELPHFPSVTTLPYGLVVIDNDHFETLNGLEAVTQMASLNVQDNDALLSMTGLENLTEITGGVYLSENPLLTSFAGLNGLVTVGDEFNVNLNNAITTIAGLEALRTVAGNLVLHSNAQLGQGCTDILHDQLIGFTANYSYNPDLADGCH